MLGWPVNDAQHHLTDKLGHPNIALVLVAGLARIWQNQRAYMSIREHEHGQLPPPHAGQVDIVIAMW